ncbi:MAG: hypothetical protein RML56_13025 [Burkholderiales bacterium]|nr:hypothetical protein [Burkholderiales bacterium]
MDPLDLRIALDRDRVVAERARLLERGFELAASASIVVCGRMSSS